MLLKFPIQSRGTFVYLIYETHLNKICAFQFQVEINLRANSDISSVEFLFFTQWTFGTKKNIKMRSFNISENIQKEEGGPGRSVSDNQSSSVNLNELAMKARKDTVISSFSKEVIH